MAPGDDKRCPAIESGAIIGVCRPAFAPAKIVDIGD
jgi:hypothetical protein